VFKTLSDSIFKEWEGKSSATKLSSSEKTKITSITTELLFQPRYNSLPEDGRIERAKAISSLAACTGPAWQDVAKSVLLDKGRLKEAVESERVLGVREILHKAGEKFQ
jgi:hypothetical protein